MNQQWKEFQPETATHNEAKPHNKLSNSTAHRIAF